MSHEMVDNSGQGNCMYYAYSISLMYFLLKKRDALVAEKIFDRLELSSASKEKLHALLNNKELTRFTHNQICNIIEPILGSATRKIAAEQLKQKFIEGPKDTSLFSSLNYGMVYLLRKELEKRQSPLAALIQKNNFDLPDYTLAEIYKLFSIKSPKLQRHIIAHYDTIIRKFLAGWSPERVTKVYQEQLANFKNTIANSYKHQQEFIQELLNARKIDFSKVTERFQSEWKLFIIQQYEDNNKSIEKTILAEDPKLQLQFIQQVYSEKSFTFNDATRQYPQEWDARVDQLFAEQIFTKKEIRENHIYQQQFCKDMEDKARLKFIDIIAGHNDAWDDRVDTLFKAEKHTIKEDDIKVDPFFQEQFLIDLVSEATIDFFRKNTDAHLNQYRDHINTNYRWGTEDSLLALHAYIQGEQQICDTQGVRTTYNTEILLAIHRDGPCTSGTATRRPDMVLNNIANYHWHSLVPLMVTGSHNGLTKDPTTQREIECRLDLLNECGFSDYLEQFKTKVEQLKEKYPDAYKQGKDIFEQLNEVKNDFIKEDSTMDLNFFSRQCSNIIELSVKDELEKHRGIGVILNALLNGLIFVANLFIGVANSLSAEYELIAPNRIANKSINNINQINESVSNTNKLGTSLLALMEIRSRNDKKGSSASEPLISNLIRVT